MTWAWRIVVWTSVAMALVGFCQPWVRIDLATSRLAKLTDALKSTEAGRKALGQVGKLFGKITATVRRGTEEVSGTLPGLADIPRQVSGIQVPRLANQENSQVVIALFELFTKTRQRIGLKSYAVYLVPGLALLCGILLTCAGGVRPLTLSLAVACAAIAGGGFWKLLTTDTTTLFISVTIGPGLWLSLWAYVGLSLAAFARVALPPLRSAGTT